METIVIEAISDKFKNKYSSGSVLAGGKWMQVSSKLNLTDFKKDTEMTVETKTNDKGYISIVGIATEAKEVVKEVSKTPKKEKETPKVSYEDNKSRRILVQGIVQATLQAPFLAALPYTNKEDAVKLIKDISLELIDFVDESCK